jgi:hypothetical protein
MFLPIFMEEFVKKLIKRSERFFINALKDFEEKI